MAEGISQDIIGAFGAVSVSANGVFTYRTAGGSRRQLIWFDRHGRQLGTLGEVDDTIRGPELSPDGQRVTVDRALEGNRDIWVIDTLRMTRLTFDPAPDAVRRERPQGIGGTRGK